MDAAEILLTDEQRLEFTRIPPNIDDWEIAKHYTFSEKDKEIINRRRRDYNRLGFAVQLGMLRNPGWVLTSFDDIPEPVLEYIAEQIGVNANEIFQYSDRVSTRIEHLQELRDEYDYRNFTGEDSETLFSMLLSVAIENDNVTHLMKIAIESLRKQKIILPGITTVERILQDARIKAEYSVFERINTSITDSQRALMDYLVSSRDEYSNTKLGWLRADFGYPSPKTFREVIFRLEEVRSMNLALDTNGIHPNRIRQISRLGESYEPYAFRRFDEKKRYAILAVYLNELSQTLVDKAIEIHEKQINILLSKGRKKLESIQKENGKSLNEKLIHYVGIGEALIKAREEGRDPLEAVESVMDWDKVVSSVEEAKKLTRPANYDYIDLLDGRYSQLRKYSPLLLKYLKFKSSGQATKPLVDALELIHEMNEDGKRKIPLDAPLEFISNRWSRYVFEDDGSINRHYYEMAALSELKNKIRSGDISVEGSRNHKDFEEYLISKDDWECVKGNGSGITVNPKVSDYLEERTKSLSTRLEWLSKNMGKLKGMSIENGKIRLERLEKESSDESSKLSQRLYDMLPKIKLPDLLLEVADWTGFEKNFLHASTKHPVKGEEKTVVMAALMAMGTNIGLTKMADATPEVTYRQLANSAQWRLYEDAMKKAQATLVNYHHRLFLPSYWGDGSTSSSDGMRVQVGVSSLSADANPHYGSGKGATMYRFVSDKFSTFYTKIISTNARDAVHVIDGLLYHETDLNIEEHYTDTAGYTDQVFGLSHLLGFKFAPRIRDISEIKLYKMDSNGSFPKVESILNGKISLKAIQENYDDVLRLAYSIREGKVSGSLIMEKLGSYSRQNSLATALREMGRIEKTIFILDYISDEALRRRIQRGLNKGEFMNALARALFFGKRGELRSREMQDQLMRASALNILINAISIWNTVYLQEAVNHLKNNGGFDEKLLKKISPLGWEHISLLGEYHFKAGDIPKGSSLRPLNI